MLSTHPRFVASLALAGAICAVVALMQLVADRRRRRLGIASGTASVLLFRVALALASAGVPIAGFFLDQGSTALYGGQAVTVPDTDHTFTGAEYATDYIETVGTVTGVHTLTLPNPIGERKTIQNRTTFPFTELISDGSNVWALDNGELAIFYSTDGSKIAKVETPAAGAWAPVDTVATTAITLSGEQTIGGLTTSASRVLVTAQTPASGNGIYTTSSSAWSRAQDALTATQYKAGKMAMVGNAGSTLYGSLWGNTGLVAIVGTSSQTWVETSGGGGSTAIGGALTGTLTDAGLNFDGGVLAGIIPWTNLVPFAVTGDVVCTSTSGYCDASVQSTTGAGTTTAYGTSGTTLTDFSRAQSWSDGGVIEEWDLVTVTDGGVLVVATFSPTIGGVELWRVDCVMNDESVQGDNVTGRLSFNASTNDAGTVTFNPTVPGMSDLRTMVDGSANQPPVATCSVVTGDAGSDLVQVQVSGTAGRVQHWRVYPWHTEAL